MHSHTRLVIAAVIFATPVAVASSAIAAPARPCEDVLVELRAAKTQVTPDAATQKKVEELEAKGVERCNADDDKRADAFFADALKLLGK